MVLGDKPLISEVVLSQKIGVKLRPNNPTRCCGRVTHSLKEN
jgi:hypothetical protein